MKFKPEDFKAKTVEIMQSLSDPAKVTLLLTELVEGHVADCAAEETLKKEKETLTAENTGLVKANSALFLKVGVVPADKGTEKPNESTATKPKFDDLFDENGKLK